MWRPWWRRLFWIFWTAWSLAIGTAKAEIDGLKVIKAGDPAPADGYWMPVEYGQDVATAWSQAERDREAWETAYVELKDAVDAEGETLQSAIAELKASLIVDGQRQREIGRNQALLWVLLGTGIGVWVYNN